MNCFCYSIVLLLMSYGLRLYKLCFEFKVSFSKKRYEELWLQNRVLGFKTTLLSSKVPNQMVPWSAFIIFGSNA